MTWNYRVVRTRTKNHEGQYEYEFVIKEVYYNKDGSIWSITKEPMQPYGSTLKELRLDMNHMLVSFDSPVLDEWKIKFTPAEEEKE